MDMNKVKERIKKHKWLIAGAAVGTAAIAGYLVGVNKVVSNNDAVSELPIPDDILKEPGERVAQIAMVFGDEMPIQTIWNDCGRCVSTIEGFSPDTASVVLKQAVANIKNKFPDAAGLDWFDMTIETKPD